MKIKDLLKEIAKCKKLYGKDFLDWDIYIEPLSEEDKRYKFNWQVNDIIGDNKRIYFKHEGNFTKFPKKKIFTININY